VGQTNLNALTARNLLPGLVKSLIDDLKPSGANAATSMSLYAPNGSLLPELEPAPTMSLARAIQPMNLVRPRLCYVRGAVSGTPQLLPWFDARPCQSRLAGLALGLIEHRPHSKMSGAKVAR
jgi:hypothetical protein